GGVGYVYLIVAIGCAAMLVAVRANAMNALMVPRHAMFLLGFLTYFCVRLFFDVNDFAEVKAVTVGTTGGIVFGIALGTMAAVFAGVLHERKGRSLPHAARVFLFLAICWLLAMDAL